MLQRLKRVKGNETWCCIEQLCFCGLLSNLGTLEFLAGVFVQSKNKRGKRYLELVIQLKKNSLCNLNWFIPVSLQNVYHLFIPSLYAPINSFFFLIFVWTIASKIIMRLAFFFFRLTAAIPPECPARNDLRSPGSWVLRDWVGSFQWHQLIRPHHP